MTLKKHPAMSPPGAYCFGCNRPFEGAAPAVTFETDLVPEADRAEVANMYFHPGHLIRYAHRRNWTELADYLELNGSTNF